MLYSSSRRSRSSPGSWRTITARDRRVGIYKRVGLVLSAVTVLLGLAMIGSTLARVGPSFSVGVVLGGLLVVYGTLRLYWTLKG